MTPSRSWILFSALRIGLFAVVLTVLLLLQIEPWIAALLAAVIGLCVSYIFFRPQREALAKSVSEYRSTEHRDEDADAESAAVDGSVGDGSEGDRRREADAEEQGAETGQLQREDELGRGTPGERDDHRG
ncbi:MAG: hypothetical protein RI885_431 [Actinomycetota bacterium]